MRLSLVALATSLLAPDAAEAVMARPPLSHQPTGHHAGRSSIAAHIGQKPEEAARAVRLPLAWTDPVSGHSWNLQPLMLPGSAYVFHDMMTDEEHDSIHAKPAEKEKAAVSKKSGRLLDQVKTTDLLAASSPPAGEPKGPVRPVHPYNPDEYDFWVNVGTNVVGAPSICDTSKPAPVYQVVVPRQPSEEELEQQDREIELRRQEMAAATGDAGEERPSYHKLERALRPAAVPTQCYALGSIDNVSFSLISPHDPGHGVSLTYFGGDECMKKVMTPRGPAPAAPGQPNAPADYGYLQPSWVPTPRSVSLHIRCDESDKGTHDVASFLQLVKRVRVVEAEMCEYVVEWPSRWGCSRPPGGIVGAARHLAAAPSLLRPLLLLLAVLVAVYQLFRQWPAIQLLLPGLRGGERGAWKRLGGVLVSHKEPLRRRHSKVGHDV